MYHWLCKDPPRRNLLFRLLKIHTVICIGQFLLPKILPLESALLVVGTVSAIMSVVVTASPCAMEMTEILRKQSAEALPLDIILAGFASSGLWVCCGLILNDRWVFVTNFIGLFIGGLQLSLIASLPGTKDDTPPLQHLSMPFYGATLVNETG